MRTALKFIEQNALVILYSVMFYALCQGVVISSGADYVPHLLLYYVAFLSSYILIKKVGGEKDWFNKVFNKIKELRIPYINTHAHIILSGLILLNIIIHLIDLGSIPVLKAYNSENYYEIVNIRKEITQITSTKVRYFSFFAIKAIIPFTLLLLYIRKKWYLYTFMLCISSMYAVSLMQKSYILTVLFPLIVFTLLNKKLLFTLKYIGIVVCGIYILLYVSNPQLREIEIPEEVIQEQKRLAEEIKKENEEKGISVETVSASERNAHFLRAIYTRVILVPGQMVADWFHHIPKSEPFLKGNGYRFLIPIIGGEYENYSQKLYPHIYPTYAKRGIQGNANAASFMYDYSNFGSLGLILSGVILAIIFIVVDTLFKQNFMFKLSLNSFYILMLSSSALSTLLFSGGWGIILFLYIFVKPEA